MKFKQTLILQLFSVLFLMLAWETACFAQNDSDNVLRGRRIEALPVIVEGSEYGDTLYLHDEEEYEDELVSTAASTGPSANDEYLKEDIREHDFNRQNWREASEGLDYSKDKPAREEKDDQEAEQDPAVHTTGGAGLGATTQILLFGGIIVILALLLFLLVGGKYTKNTKIKSDSKNFTVEDIEERIHESDLDRFLREALAKNDFRLAVRIYYLAIIKELSLKDLIRWKKDKTNREYLNEVVSRKPEIYQDFRETTLAYEKVWYGDIIITEGDYMSISPRFKKFIDNLSRLN